MNKPRILLVEDNPDDEALTLRALRRHNVANEVVVARDGVEALDYLFARGPHAGRDVTDLPALVLLDIKLPKVDGFEVLRQVRADARMKALPVVMFTSSKEEVDLARAYDDGANSYVRKPVDFSDFTEAVTRLGCYWMVLNETPAKGA
jgi:two-component system response regulator